MTFLRRNNGIGRIGGAPRRSMLWPLVALFVAALALSFSFSRDALFAAASPLWKAEQSVLAAVSGGAALLQSKAALVAENASLRAEIASTTEERLLADAALAENADLKALLNRPHPNAAAILAAVVVRPFLSPYDTLVVDAGTTEGVRTGDRAMAGASYIGDVTSVAGHTAVVTLYSSPGQKTPVLVGTSSVPAEADGIGGGGFEFKLPAGTPVAVGDVVVAPGTALNVFGTVQKVEAAPTDAFQTVFFGSPVNIESLRWVEIVPAPGA